MPLVIYSVSTLTIFKKMVTSGNTEYLLTECSHNVTAAMLEE